MRHIRVKTMTTWLECHECNEMFEVSNAIAEAMHHWRAESGDPFLCVDCTTHIEWGDAIQQWTEKRKPIREMTMHLMQLKNESL